MTESDPTIASGVIAVVGSRDGVDLTVVAAYVRQIFGKYPNAMLISGGARGVDQAAESTAQGMGKMWRSARPAGPYPHDRGSGKRENLFRIEMFGHPTPQGYDDPWELGAYDTYKDAAYARNTMVAEAGMVLVAFTSGSRGTAHTISEAARMGRRVFIHGPDGAPVQAHTAVCGSCKATMVFTPTPNGKLIPLDVGANPDGNMVVRAGIAIQTEAEDGEDQRMPHHATCPHAARYRGSRAQRRARAR